MGRAATTGTGRGAAPSQRSSGSARHHPHGVSGTADDRDVTSTTVGRARHTGSVSRVGPPVSTHRVVVIGSGFGGLFGTQALRRRKDVEITLIASTTHHLFQPLLYQVATGILSEGEIAPPTREILSSQDNARVILGEVTGIDLAAKTVTSQVLGRDTVTSY